MKRKTIFIIIIIVAIAAVTAVFIYPRWKTILHTDEISGTVKKAPGIDFYHCGMHPWITSDKPGKCPICGMTLTPVYKNTANKALGVVQIDPAMVQNIGVKTEPVAVRTLTRSIRATGIVDYDETKLSDITIKYSGFIEKLYVDFTGQSIRKGQPMFDIYSPELVAAQQEYLQAVKYKNMGGGKNPSVISGSDELLKSARQKLSLWDITDKQISRLEQSGEVKKTLTVYAPFSGVVIEKNVFDGMSVQAGMNLFKLADLSKMWVNADVYANELGWVKKGTKAVLQLPYDAGKTITGIISYIYPFIQNQTRTARVRIEVINPGDILKKDMYLTVTISPSVTIKAITVPAQAVIHSGKRDILVLSLGKGKFKSVEVKLGALADNYYEVLSGVKEGDIIVTSSQFLIDSESNLEAGTSVMQTMPGMDVELKSGDSTKSQTP